MAEADQATKMEKEQARNKLKIETLSTIVSRLFDALLISEEEKLEIGVLQPMEMEAAIFNLMYYKDSTMADKILFVVRSVKDEQETENKNAHNQLRHPMEIVSVVRNLFKFLKVEDLKTCRLVCQKWNFVAEPLTRKNSTITFGRLKNTNKIRLPQNFLETFRHFSAPFTSFHFSEGVEWRVSDLKKFFDHQKSNIKELQLCGVKIFNEDKDKGEEEGQDEGEGEDEDEDEGEDEDEDENEYVDEDKDEQDEHDDEDYETEDEDEDNDEDWLAEYDISDWFADFCVSKLTISCIDKDRNDTTFFEFPLNVLTFTTHIKLEQCKIEIGNDRRIAPIAIDLVDLKLCKDGNFLPEYCINDLIDFSKAKDIRLTSYGEDDGHELATDLRLDMNKCLGLSANYISLNGIKIDNWKDSNVVTETLVLTEIPFLEKNEMEIKELYIRSYSEIDLFALPLSIESIHIDSYVETDTISCSQPITLSNLQFLKVQNSKHLPIFFANCPNLRDIEIYNVGSYFRDIDALNLNWIPKSVKRMKLEGVEFGVTVSSKRPKLKLEKLVLENFPLPTAAKFLDKIAPAILVLQWDRELEMSGSVLLFLPKFKGSVLFIGPFIWDDFINVFERSPLMAHVDKKAEYYVFENNQGRSIQRKEFKDMKKLAKN